VLIKTLLTTKRFPTVTDVWFPIQQTSASRVVASFTLLYRLPFLYKTTFLVSNRQAYPTAYSKTRGGRLNQDKNKANTKTRGGRLNK
jgi:hypothetical protein